MPDFGPALRADPNSHNIQEDRPVLPRTEDDYLFTNFWEVFTR